MLTNIINKMWIKNSTDCTTAQCSNNVEGTQQQWNHFTQQDITNLTQNEMKYVSSI